MDRLTRRHIFSLGVSAAAVSILPACGTPAGGGGGSGGTGGGESKTVWPTYVAPKVVNGAAARQIEGVPTLYTEPVSQYFDSTTGVPGSGKELSTFQLLWGTPPQEKSRNKYWPLLEKKLGVQLKPTYQALANYSDKLATLLASGTVPDIAFVIDDHAITQQAMDDGAFADLTDTLAGDKIKQWPNLANVSTQVWKNSARKGRIMGIPPELGSVNVMTIVRDDILKAIGVTEAPKDAPAFLAMISELVKLRTFGGKEFWPIGTLEYNTSTWIEGMFRIGPAWQVSGGKVISALETPGYPAYLEFLNKLVIAKAFHPDGLGGTNKENLFTQGQLAMTQNGMGGFVPMLTDVPKNTPGASISFQCPRAFDGGDPQFVGAKRFWGLTVISAKAAKDPARLKELLDILNFVRAPYGSTERLFLANGVEGTNFKFDDRKNITRIDPDADRADQKALTNFGISSQPTWYLPKEFVAKADNLMDTAEKYAKFQKADPLLGLIAPSAATLDTKLTQIATDYRIGIATGRRPLSDHAQMVKDYLANGGSTLKSELQKLYDERLAGK